MEKADGGSILAITSMADENKKKRMAFYGSSKAATNHLIRNIAFDLGPKGIRINGIAPGATRTDALESVLNDDIEKKMLAHRISGPNRPILTNAEASSLSDLKNAAEKNDWGQPKKGQRRCNQSGQQSQLC